MNFFKSSNENYSASRNLFLLLRRIRKFRILINCNFVFLLIEQQSLIDGLDDINRSIGALKTLSLY